MNILDQLSAKQMKDAVPEFKVGDMVKIDVKVKEGKRERIQIFQGTVIQKKGSGVSETFTVRKISGGIGVERVFPLHSPILSDIKVMRKGKVRRAKLYYLRELKGKAARIKEKKDNFKR